MRKKLFTIIELLISLVIVGILIGVLFKVYIKLSDISIRIENEKNLNNEIFFISQTLQNLSDRNNIDFTKYSNLKDTFGIVNILYLTGKDGNIEVYFTGECYNDLSLLKTTDCWVQMRKDGNILDLTDKNKVYFVNPYFKIQPYEDLSLYNLSFDNIYQNGFSMYFQSYIKRYDQKSWPFDVMMNYQTFYNIRKY